VVYNPEIHRRRSIRLKGYDYTLSGSYFITIVTHERECLFGEITNSEMTANKFGLVAQQMWDKLSVRFRNVELGAFVVMPNHVHGIILLDGTRRGIAEGATDSDDQSPRYAPTMPDRQFGKMIPGSIPAIIVHINRPWRIGSTSCADYTMLLSGNGIIMNTSSATRTRQNESNITSNPTHPIGRWMM
jgi:putative transposase